MKISIDKAAKLIYHKKTYMAKEIQKSVNSVANALTKMNRAGTVVVCMDRSPELIYSIMAVLSVGMTYVPVSTSLPKNRLEYVLNNCDADVVITNYKHSRMFEGLPVICVEDVNEEDASCVYKQADINETAYIIYTSGTTGVPKGVEVSYGGLKSFFEAFQQKILFDKTDCIISCTDISFDISFVEGIMALLLGLKVVLADNKEQNNPRLLMKLITEHDVNVIQMTPSRMSLIKEIDTELTCLKKVKKILIGGEAFPIKLLEILKDNTGAQIFNLYGPTEATIWTTISDLTDKDKVDIGTPLSNSQIYLLDDELNKVPYGKVGEIGIVGNCLAKGYFNDLDLTEQKFVFPSWLNGDRLYRTGDFGKYDSEGALIYMGRKDNQIKYRGYRIELEEIENVINSIKGIEDSFVVYERDSLIAIYKAATELEIRKCLQEKLPEYMIPILIIKTDVFEYTTNGKLDKKLTYENVMEKYNKSTRQAIDIEKKVTDIILGIVNQNLQGYFFTDMESNFKEMGMDSLAFINMIVSVEKEFNFEFEDEKLSLYEFPDVLSLVKYVIQRIKQV